MGCYDTLVMKCIQCKGTVKFQSKAGSCDFSYYNKTNVPNKIAVDLENDTEFCDSCNKEFKLGVQIIRDIRLVEEEEYEE